MYFNRLLFFQILFSFLRGIFVLLNRKNNPTMAGLISGAEHSGKTFQCKREIFNALAGSDDTVFVVTADDSYDGFVKELGGIVAEFPKTNPFEMATHYGLSEPDAYSKSVMLEALFSSMVEKKKDSINFTDNEKLILKDGDDEEDTIEKEIQILCESCSEFNVPEMLCGIQIKPQSYKGNADFLLKAKEINNHKNEAFSREYKVPVFYVYYDDSGFVNKGEIVWFVSYTKENMLT